MDNPSDQSSAPNYDGTIVAPFTMKRLFTVIESKGYHCSFEESDNSISGAWNYVNFRFTLSEIGVWLRVSSAWDPPEELTVLEEDRVLAILQEAANEWNRQYLQPTAYPSRTDEGWKVLLDQSIYVEHGVTDAQIELAIDRTLDVCLQAHDTVGALLPPLL